MPTVRARAARYRAASRPDRRMAHMASTLTQATSRALSIFHELTRWTTGPTWSSSS